MAWTVLQRNKKLVRGATICESVNDDDTERRFTATILGWQGFVIYKGPAMNDYFPKVIDKVREIRDRIEAGDEEIFKHKGQFLSKEA